MLELIRDFSCNFKQTIAVPLIREFEKVLFYSLFTFIFHVFFLSVEGTTSNEFTMHIKNVIVVVKVECKMFIMNQKRT